MESVGFFTAFFAGILSFVSPCVLPIVPGYLSFISGVSLEEMKDASARKSVMAKVFLNSLFFVIGFSVIFIGMGASATLVGAFLREFYRTFEIIGGAIIAALGLIMILQTFGVLFIPFLNYEKRVQVKSRKWGLLGSFVVGFFFGFGWTPCIGPILGAVLAIASEQDTVGKGMVLLTSYSLGLGIPFLLTSLSLNAFFVVFQRIRRYIKVIEVVAGLLLILVGVLMMTDSLTAIASLLTRWFPFLQDLS
jgi:cytochrome c-type biogenesis protein